MCDKLKKIAEEKEESVEVKHSSVKLLKEFDLQPVVLKKIFMW